MASMPATPLAVEADATQRAVRILRDMIMSRRLAPGEQLRQDHLADAMGLSRSPLREALRMLETEGLLSHVPNQGYFVVRLSSSDLRQVYLMRRLLETELYRTLRRPAAGEMQAIRRTHREIREGVGREDVTAVLEANRRFHFSIFELSPLGLVMRQVAHLWHVSESYRAAYLWLPEAQRRIVAEHASMLQCLETGDRRGLMQIADRHRAAAESTVVRLLGGEASVESR